MRGETVIYPTTYINDGKGRYQGRDDLGYADIPQIGAIVRIPDGKRPRSYIVEFVAHYPKTRDSIAAYDVPTVSVFLRSEQPEEDIPMLS